MSQLHSVKKGRKPRKKISPVIVKEAQAGVWHDEDGAQIDSQHLLISMLLPSAVKAYLAEVEAEVARLCGSRYSHGAQGLRWGSQPGSIVLGRQRVAVERQRVRDRDGRELPIETYTRFQSPEIFDEAVFNEGLKRVSQRDFEIGLPKIAASFGVSKSSVSRSWIRTTKKQVEQLLSRDLTPLKIVAVYIDGKRFEKLGVVVALGVAEDGKKYVLGIYQSSTENSVACRELLNDLERRGMPDSGLLFVVDGGSGLNKALNEKYELSHPERRRAVRVRCWVHKWRNIEESLDDKDVREIKPLFTAVREASDLSRAQAAALVLEAALRRVNSSALRSWLEAKDDLLNLHRLGVGPMLRATLATTNPIESLNSLLEEDMRRVKRWRDSEHFQRWLATACLRNEKRMRRVKGHRGLAALVIRLEQLCASIGPKKTTGLDSRDQAA
jgi:putative transposase